MQNFQALEAPPPDRRASGSWELCPQTPIGLRWLGVSPPDPQNSPPLRISAYAPGTNYTVVCDRIANKSFVLLNANILGEYRKKPSLRSASQARFQDSVTGGHKQVLEGHKIYFESERVDQKITFFIAKFHEIWGRPKKRSSSRNIRGFSRILEWRQKKGSSSQKMR